ncbi:MAG: MGMT family protein [Bryobacter sp.]|nr:MGMT family protein [Bryobacter sp.]
MTVPAGRVAVCAEIAECLEVMPRHVAYILSTLPEHEEALVPWYRAVNAAGRLLNPRKAERAHRQAALLRAEGVRVLQGFVVEDFARRRFRFR